MENQFSITLATQAAGPQFGSQQHHKQQCENITDFQQRLLGAALGSAMVGSVVFEQRKRIYDSIADERPQLYAQSEEAILGKQYRSEFARLWNNAVDHAYGSLIESLSSRRW